MGQSDCRMNPLVANMVGCVSALLYNVKWGLQSLLSNPGYVLENQLEIIRIKKAA